MKIDKYFHLYSRKDDVVFEEIEKPERKKGKWIDKSDGIYGAWNYCSVCGEQAIDLYDFCPNCGADMRDDDIPIEYFESGGI